jgi:hypothetical protein
MNQLPSTADKPATAPRQDRRSRQGLIEDWRDALGILLLLFVAAALGAILSRLWPEGEVEGRPAMTEVDTRLSTLEARLANLTTTQDLAETTKSMEALETRLARLESQFAAVGTQGTQEPLEGAQPGTSPPPLTLLSTAMRLDETLSRLTDLETRTSNLPSSLATASKSLETLSATTTGLTARMDDVAARVERIEAADILDLARRASLSAAIANLARATQGSSPFKAEYEIVAAMLPDESGLARLAPFARTGLPTTGILLSRFSKTAADALDAERKAQQQDSVSRLWNNFSGLVSWRTTSGDRGSSTERHLARAEQLLKAGDLEAAVKELSMVKGAAAKPMGPWLKHAKARVQIETILARLNTKALDAMTSDPTAEQGSGTGPRSR